MTLISRLQARSFRDARPFLGGLILSALLAALPNPVRAATDSVIHVFAGPDGYDPMGGLAISKAGALYGTTYGGGAAGAGTVFAVTPPTVAGGAWTERVLFSLNGTSDGANPQAGLLWDGVSTLYGTSFSGGGPALAGTVFKLTRPATAGGAWASSVLYSFGGADGKAPRGTLIAGAGGVLYGTTQLGGASKAGTVFSLTPPVGGVGPWTEAVLYSFGGGADGANPKAGLVLGTNGALYGTVTAGGAFGLGAVFMLAPPAAGQTAWSETVLHSFAGGADGANPVAGLINKNGTLYGTTNGSATGANADTVFKLKPPATAGGLWKETILYTFAGGTDGANPTGTLAFGKTASVLYGTTAHGGALAVFFGTAYKLTAPATGSGPWTKTILYGFNGATDGGNPAAGLAFFKKTGALFGVNTRGGSAASAGTVFEIAP